MKGETLCKIKRKLLEIFMEYEFSLAFDFCFSRFVSNLYDIISEYFAGGPPIDQSAPILLLQIAGRHPSSPTRVNLYDIRYIIISLDCKLNSIHTEIAIMSCVTDIECYVKQGA